ASLLRIPILTFIVVAVPGEPAEKAGDTLLRCFTQCPGKCIVFYTSSQISLLKSIERMAGIEFLRIGTPQTSEIVKAAAVKSSSLLRQVHPAMLRYFEVIAQSLIDEAYNGDAVKALSGMRIFQLETYFVQLRWPIYQDT